MRYISEIREGENVVEHFLCKSKQTLKSRAGKSYLSLKLQDKTGTVDAKVWELNNDIKAFEENEFIKIDGTAIVYQNDIQLATHADINDMDQTVTIHAPVPKTGDTSMPFVAVAGSIAGASLLAGAGAIVFYRKRREDNAE